MDRIDGPERSWCRLPAVLADHEARRVSLRTDVVIAEAEHAVAVAHAEALLAQFADRVEDPSRRPEGAEPVTAFVSMHPQALLPAKAQP